MTEHYPNSQQYQDLEELQQVVNLHLKEHKLNKVRKWAKFK